MEFVRHIQPYGYGITTEYSTGRIFFTTADGISYFVDVMGWTLDEDGKAIPGSQKYSNRQKVFVDLNGLKEPNTLGKDVFMFEVNFQSNIVRPESYSSSDSTIKNNCSKNGSGTACAAKIMKDGWTIKDDYPW